jgi:predicted dehydrogenase
MDRRSFVKDTSLTLATLSTFPQLIDNKPSLAKKRIALVGLGIRGKYMWGLDLIKKYGDVVEFVGLCDSNLGRLESGRKDLQLICPNFTNFKEMMRVTRPDIVIVCTKDSTHHEQIITGMEMGADIITEKPLTIDEIKLKSIIQAQKRTNKKITVTFNYRYSPHRQKIWELLNEGRIGKVTSVDFNWYLDTSHGADYFRRWHGKRANSGTLLVHKAAHHFDLLNWWIASKPKEVLAKGSLDFYGKNGAYRGINCRTCDYKKDCKFYWDITKSATLTRLYVENEKYDGYLRDGCVFDPAIDIYDKMGAVISYENGAQATYSLTAYSPYEGYRIAFNGTKGRIESHIHESGNYDLPQEDEIKVFTNFGGVESIKIPQSAGHGGGDDRMRDFLFRNPEAPDTYKQSAGLDAGADAILVGIAARKSIESGNPILIKNLL